MYHNLPVLFDKVIGRLSTGRTGDDKSALKVEKEADVAPEKFLITVAMEQFS
jgi:hypothetical protein